METPTLAQLRQALGDHNALSENQRLLHDPPIAQIIPKCWECGAHLPAYRLGWDDIKEAVRRGQELDTFGALATCRKCAPEDAEA